MQMDGENSQERSTFSVCHYLNGSTPQTSSSWWFSPTVATAFPTEGKMQMMPRWRAPSPECEHLGCPVELLCGQHTPQLTHPQSMTQISSAYSRADAHICLAREVLRANTDVELRRFKQVKQAICFRAAQLSSNNPAPASFCELIDRLVFRHMSLAPAGQAVTHRSFPRVCAWSWNKQTVFQLFILTSASVFSALPPKGWVTNGDSTVLSRCQGKLMSVPLKVNRKGWIVSETLMHICFFSTLRAS